VGEGSLDAPGDAEANVKPSAEGEGQETVPDKTGRRA
jgi:hypothetical protein